MIQAKKSNLKYGCLPLSPYFDSCQANLAVLSQLSVIGFHLSNEVATITWAIIKLRRMAES